MLHSMQTVMIEKELHNNKSKKCDNVYNTENDKQNTNIKSKSETEASNRQQCMVPDEIKTPKSHHGYD